MTGPTSELLGMNKKERARCRLARVPPAVYLAAVAVTLCTAMLYASSYWRSISIEMCDVTVTDDEGLFSVNVPLTRLASATSPRSEFVIYEHGPIVWSSGLAGRTPLRSWMSNLEARGPTSGMFLDFGFWKGGWQSDSRPGPFIVLFVPIWFVGLVVFGFYLAFYFRLIHFRLRTMLIAMTVVAGLLWLLMLRQVH